MRESFLTYLELETLHCSNTLDARQVRVHLELSMTHNTITCLPSPVRPPSPTARNVSSCLYPFSVLPLSYPCPTPAPPPAPPPVMSWLSGYKHKRLVTWTHTTLYSQRGNHLAPQRRWPANKTKSELLSLSSHHTTLPSPLITSHHLSSPPTTSHHLPPPPISPFLSFCPFSLKTLRDLLSLKLLYSPL